VGVHMISTYTREIPLVMYTEGYVKFKLAGLDSR
jgi:hypothetical protein